MSTVSFKAAVAATGVALSVGVIETLGVDVTQVRHVIAVLLYPWTALVSTPCTTAQCHSPPLTYVVVQVQQSSWRVCVRVKTIF